MTITAIDVSKVTSKFLKDKVYLASFPEYYELATVTENGLWHNHQNVLDHVIEVFAGLETVLTFNDLDDKQSIQIRNYLSQQIGNKIRLDALKVATLLHDIAKTDVLVIRPDGSAGCPGHDFIAAGRVKIFAKRFDLDNKAQSYVKRIVLYHGFISEILNLMIANRKKEKYLKIFSETVGDISIELVLLMHADLLGSDLEKGDKQGYDERINLLSWILEHLLL